MARQRLTPEERLFHVIQRDGGASDAPPGPRRDRMQRLRVFWRNAVSGLSLRLVTRVLMLLVALCVVSGVALPALYRPSLSVLEAEAASAGPVPVYPAPTEGLRSQDDYLQLITIRHPFKPAGFADQQVTAAPHEEPAATEARLAKQHVGLLRLVGIAREHGGVPVAMVEQAEEQRTYFLKVGDVVEQLTVEEIHPDHVVLRMGEAIVDLY